jgi:hypothetical protein
MIIKFTDIVKVSMKKCKTCFTLRYLIPCELEKDIVKYLANFDQPKFDLDTVSLLDIETSDDYKIKGRLGSVYIKFGIPKEFKNKLEQSRKKEFEDSLAEWLGSKLQITITT